MADLTPQELKAMNDVLMASGESADEAAAKVGKFATANKEATQATSDFTSQLNFTADGLSKITDWCARAGVKMEEIGNVTGTSAVQFGLLTTALIGSKSHFDSWIGGLDTTRLGSFNTQLNGLVEQVDRQGTGLGLATEAGKKLFSVLGSLGVGGETLGKIASGSAKSMAEFAKNILTGADNSLKLESALLQGAAKAGNLSALYKNVGDELQNLNNTNSTFINAMKDASIATHNGSKEMGEYYATLLQIPGGLEAMKSSMVIAGTSTNTLTGIIQLADGAGLDITQTFQDIHKEVASYGLTIEGATELVSRYVDVSKDLNAQQDDVRTAIKNTTDVFKGFVMTGVNAKSMTQGLTDTVKNWAQALEKAGVPAQQALDQATRYTTAMQGMGEAQEAFISAQSGGPGGLLGALKFEDLLRKDPAKASAEIADTMKKYMTRSGYSGILSRDEAVAGGQGGARQYELQRQLAMSGVFGIKAKSKEEADTMIEALKSGADLGKAMAPEEKKKMVQDTMAKGKKQEELTATQVDKATITADYASLQAGNINLGFLQSALSARSGTSTGTTDQQKLLREEMTGAGSRTPVPGTASLMKDVGQSATDIMPAFEGAASQAKMLFTGENPADAASAGNLSTSSSMSASSSEKNPAAQAALKNATRQQSEGQTGRGADLKTLLSNAGFHKKGESAETPKTAGQTVATHATGQPIPVTLVGSGLTVNFTGKCPHCGFGIHTTEQAAVQSAPSTLPR